MEARLRVPIEVARGLHVGQKLDIQARAFVTEVRADLVDVSSMDHPETYLLGGAADLHLEIDIAGATFSVPIEP